MSTPKTIGPPPPPALTEWEGPSAPEVGGNDNGLERPDNSFHDDHIGSHIKFSEAEKARLVADRFVQEAPRRILQDQQRVVEAGAFRPAQQEDDEVRRADRNRQAQQRPRGGGRKRGPRRDPRTIAGGTEPSVQRVEDKIEALWGDLEAIEEQLAAWDETVHAAPESQPDAAAQVDAAAEAQRLRLADRKQRLETAAKQQLQLLLAGGIGLSLLGDPRLTFKRLFERIETWPKGVTPGHKPVTPEEFDAFVAYVFEPPRTEAEADYW
jgi:hypothetical protein